MTENRTVTFDPAQWQLVPKCPTEDQLVSGQESYVHGPRGAVEDCREAEDIYRAMLAAAPEYPSEQQERCPHCDGTGDVHSADGEWRGTCTCEAGSRIREGKQ